MQLKIYKNYEALSEAASDEMVNAIKNNTRAVICMASGDSPKLTARLFVEKLLKSHIDYSQFTLVALDEWVGVPPENTGSCYQFFKQHVFEPLSLSVNQTLFFNSLAKDAKEECQKMDEAIAARGGIHLMLVGIGMNGHIGFNEPGVAENLYAHVVPLDEITQSVGQKYFQQSMVLKEGITLGFQHLLESHKVILIANGGRKAAIIKKTMHDEISMQLPATIMRKHANSIIMIDESAAAEISGQ